MRESSEGLLPRIAAELAFVSCILDRELQLG